MYLEQFLMINLFIATTTYHAVSLMSILKLNQGVICGLSATWVDGGV